MDAAGERELGEAPSSSTSQKSPDAFRTISEVSTDLDVPQHVLRFWEGKFAQIRPLKRGGGRRYYRPEDVDLLRGIQHLLYGDGYTIKGVQKLLRENGVKFVVASGRREQADKTKRPLPTASAAAEPIIASSAVPIAGRLGGAPDFQPARQETPVVIEEPLPAPMPVATEAPLKLPESQPDTLFDFVSEPESITPEPQIDPRRVESAAGLLARLKAMRRDYDIRLQAAKNGR